MTIYKYEIIWTDRKVTRIQTYLHMEKNIWQNTLTHKNTHWNVHTHSNTQNIFFHLVTACWILSERCSMSNPNQLNSYMKLPCNLLLQMVLWNQPITPLRGLHVILCHYLQPPSWGLTCNLSNPLSGGCMQPLATSLRVHAITFRAILCTPQPS